MRGKRKIGVALGSGGARGLGEIGVLLWLKERGIEISCVSGCSVGSIIGAFLCVGHSPEHMKKIALDIDWVDVVRFLRLSFSTRSLFDWSRISRFLSDYFEDKKIEDLFLPFACVATDVNTGREVVFKKGNLITALSASSCIPGLFPSVEIMERSLIDGELVNPVPIDIAFELGADLVIGISARRQLKGEKPDREPRGHAFVNKMDDWIGEVMKSAPTPIAEVFKKIPHPDLSRYQGRERRFYETVTDSLAIASSRIMDLNRHFVGPHFIVEPDVGEFKNFDFDKAEDIIERGYRAAEESGYDIERFVQGK